MIFNSITFILFLILVTLIYWSLSQKGRIYLLFIASVVFYGFWRVEYVSLMFVSAINDYAMSLRIHRSDSQKKKRIYLIISIIVNLGLLFYFKYLLFFTNSFIDLFNLMGFSLDYPTLNIILPLGISFYTFQTISYTADVFRGNTVPEKNFWVYGTYVMLFPQLVAGPVLRASEVIYQLRKELSFDPLQFEYGIKRILYGLFLKVVLADNLSPIVDDCYSMPIADLSAIDIITMSFLFGYQIYFDFAGYSHIAIGCAHLLGIDFPENFNFPYFSISMKEFWKRWHISLSSWIRDYLYLPMLGQKVRLSSEGGIGQEIRMFTRYRSNLVLFATWAIMGLWHGANWTFVIWGLYHALFIFTERFTKPYFSFLNAGIKNFFSWVITLFISMLSWIPFRVTSVSEVWLAYSKLLSFNNYTFLAFRENIYLIAALVFILMSLAYLSYFYLKRYSLNRSLKFGLDVLILAFLFVFVFTFLRPISQFIYFQF